MTTAAQDIPWMQAALELARQGIFSTAPNPRVGCVIVKGGEAIGKGFHVRSGEPHAEAHALREAGAAAVAVTAPIAGVITKRQHQSRTPIAAGELLMEMGDPAQLEIEADILSADAVRLAPGTRARIRHWGGDDLDASVLRIEPGGFTKTSALGVEEQRTRVILDLTSPHAQWQTLGDAYRVVYEKPAEDPRIAALTNGARCSLMVLYKRCRTLPAANRYSSANASFPAGRPVRTGRLWILLLDHIATICMVAGRRRGAKRRTAAFR